MDVGSCWWLQLIFIVAFNVVTYGIMEFWRHFPFICIFLFSTITIIEIPFVITSDNYPIHKEKFFIVTPLLTFITFWRIAYIPLVKVKSKWQAGLIKFARGCGKYLCCMRDNFEETKVVNTTLCMELFLWFITWINIIMVVVKGLKNGDIVNSICGVVLSFTLPIPAKLLYKSYSWYVRVDRDAEEMPMNWYKDVNILTEPMGGLWTISFTLWLWTFVWIDHTNSIFLSSIHLLPPLVCLWQDSSYFIQLRAVTLTVFLWVRCPVAFFDTFPWLINGDNFPFFQDVVDNHTYVFTIIGSFNLTLSLIYTVMFIKVVYERRKSDAEKKVDEEIKMQAVNKDEDIDLL